MRRGLSRTAKFEECDIHRNLPKNSVLSRLNVSTGFFVARTKKKHEQKKINKITRPVVLSAQKWVKLPSLNVLVP